MFGDEQRFQGKMLVHNDGISSYYKDGTDSHIGPGHYYDAQKESSRSWNKKDKTLSMKRNVKPGEGLDRSHHYRAGVLLHSGLMLSGNRASNVEGPGPGYYEPVVDTDIQYVTSKERAKGPTFGNGKSRAIINRSNTFAEPGSPSRAADNSIYSSVLKDGLLIKLVGNNDSHLGPGTYDVPLSSFEVRSFNKRVNKSLQQTYKVRSPTRGELRSPDARTGSVRRRNSFQGIPIKMQSF